jgi:hypothetical protein
MNTRSAISPFTPEASLQLTAGLSPQGPAVLFFERV